MNDIIDIGAWIDQYKTKYNYISYHDGCIMGYIQTGPGTFMDSKIGDEKLGLDLESLIEEDELIVFNTSNTKVWRFGFETGLKPNLKTIADLALDMGIENIHISYNGDGDSTCSFDVINDYIENILRCDPDIYVGEDYLLNIDFDLVQGTIDSYYEVMEWQREDQVADLTFKLFDVVE